MAGQDFQNMIRELQENTRALNAHTEALRHLSGGPGGGGGGLPGTTAGLGGTPGSGAPGASSGQGISPSDALSTTGRLLTAGAGASPAAGALGALASGAAGGPAGLAFAAVGLVGASLARGNQEHAEADLARLGPVANRGHMTPGQAELLGVRDEQRKNTQAYIRREMDLANGRGDALDSLLDFTSGDEHRANARHAANVQATNDQRISDVLDPEFRARARLEQRLERVMHLGNLDSPGGRSRVETLFKYFHGQEARHEANERVLDDVIRKYNAARSGTQRGLAHR